MVNFKSNVFPLNSLAEDIEGRGTYPLVEEWIEVTPGALVAGTIDVDVNSVLGKGLGEVSHVSGVSAAAAGEILGGIVIPHATEDGKLTVSIFSSDVASTTDFGTFIVKVVGRIGQ